MHGCILKMKLRFFGQFQHDYPLSTSEGSRPVRLATLLGIRWLAIFGQAAGVLLVGVVLGYPLPVPACLAVIGVSIALNIILLLRMGIGARASVANATAQLAFDLLQLGALLYLTGGLNNPFSLLLLAPVSVSATTLPRDSTMLLAALAIVVASAIGLFHWPLPWDPFDALMFDLVYVVGLWVSIVCGVAFIAAYTNRVAHEARQLNDALAATELTLSRREKLSALDGLAAAAAHELATPLSTIALAAKEMQGDLPPGPLADDVALIIDQAARCRAILAKLRSLKSDESGDPFARSPIGDLLEEVAKPLEASGKAILVDLPDEEDEPVFQRNAGVLSGLGNLIENATQFAKSRVDIAASWDGEEISVTITDDGPGFPDDLLARLGEPYLTTRARNAAPEGTEPGGLGLGIFIAKTLLERSGARLSFSNVAGAGARVRVAWPRRAIEDTTAFDLAAASA